MIQKMWKFKQMMKQKNFKFEKCSNLKIVHIVKLFKSKNCSNFKIVHTYKYSYLKII
jgi:hypothetical protein